jgi:cytochrome c553
MEILAFLAPWVLIGIGVIFVSFSGGPSQAREAYLTRGGKVFAVVIVLVFVGMGVAVPAVVIANRGEREGNSAILSQRLIRDAPDHVREGKQFFTESCAACHTLGAVNARGVTGPDLDNIGTLTPQRVLSAIKIGGTGQMRMPANLLQGEDAQAVANFVARVAGK